MHSTSIDITLFLLLGVVLIFVGPIILATIFGYGVYKHNRSRENRFERSPETSTGNGDWPGEGRTYGGSYSRHEQRSRFFSPLQMFLMVFAVVGMSGFTILMLWHQRTARMEVTAKAHYDRAIAQTEQAQTHGMPMPNAHVALPTEPPVLLSRSVNQELRPPRAVGAGATEPVAGDKTVPPSEPSTPGFVSKQSADPFGQQAVEVTPRLPPVQKPETSQEPTATQDRPDWMDAPSTPDLFIASSQRFVTLEEANQQAYEIATTGIKKRFVQDHPEANGSEYLNFSRSLVDEFSIKDRYVESFEMDLNTDLTAKMHRVHLLVQLSPEAMQQFAGVWKKNESQVRSIYIGSIGGTLFLTLAIVSVVLRLPVCSSHPKTIVAMLVAIVLLTVGGLMFAGATTNPQPVPSSSSGLRL